MAVTYERVNWVDEPSTDTPLSAENLNKMDEGISELAEWSGEVEESIDDLIERVDGVEDNVSTLNTDVNDLKDDFSQIISREDLIVYQTSDGWALTGTGAAVRDSNSRIVKYAVTAGDSLYLNLSKDNAGVYQWQKSTSVPTGTSFPDLIGEPVTVAVDEIVTVPSGATYLIVSQLNTNATNSVQNVIDRIASLETDMTAMATATTSDEGKALKAKTVSNGKVTEWEFGEAGGSEITVPAYDATKTYPVGSYVTYDDGMYRSNVPITTAEAWNSEHWTAITVSDLIADMNERLDMVVTMQEVEEEPVTSSSQIVDPSTIDWRQSSSDYRAYVPKIPLENDGCYYPNPYAETSSDTYKPYYFAHFYDAYDNELTLTKQSDASTTNWIHIFNTWGAYIEIENKRTLHLYVRGLRNTTYVASADIAYMGGSQAYFGYWTTSEYDGTQKIGVTYNEHSATYIPYSGTPIEPTYEFQYIPAMAEYVQTYMEAHGTAASNNMFNYFYPEANNSEFVNAVKYYHERSDRQRNNVIRVASFNKFVSRGQSNWSTIKQELADYSIDICGFQECAAITSEGTVTNQIGQYLQGWQFGGYAVQDAVVDKAIASHWEVTHTDLITLLTHDGGTTSNCIHALMTIPSDTWYSNAINAIATLSVYSYHGSSSGKTIGGVSYTSYEVRQMEITALLAILAQDTADFIVIVGDTNCFETGFDITTGTHHEWEMFRTAGFTPVLDGHDSSVTGDVQDRYFCKADNDEVFCIACYDQIFIGANITAKKFGVVDSNLYPVASLGNVPVSDHCMVYADLEFDFDAVQQAKLQDIAVTEPWWNT